MAKRAKDPAHAAGDRRRARRELADKGRDECGHGPPDAAGLGDPFQRADPDGSGQYSFARCPPKLNETHKAFLAQIVHEGPIPAIHGVVRWRACDLVMRLHEEFGLSMSDDTVYRALKALGFSHVSARPRVYNQNADATGTFRKTSPSAKRKSVEKRVALGTSLEVWFQDEMRVGQKSKLTYRWAHLFCLSFYAILVRGLMRAARSASEFDRVRRSSSAYRLIIGGPL